MDITIKEKNLDEAFTKDNLEITGEVQEAGIDLILHDEHDKHSVSSNSMEISEAEPNTAPMEDQEVQKDKENIVVNVSINQFSEDSESLKCDIETGNDNELSSVNPEKSTMECDLPALSEQSLNITAVTLLDGTTALVHTDIENWATDENDATKYIKAQEIQFENGATAYIRVEDYQKLLPENSDVEKSNEEAELLPKIVGGRTVELQEGVTAILPPDGSGEKLEAVQLPNGATAYISSGVQLFDAKSSNSAINLESNLSHSSSPLTSIPVTCTLTTDDKEMVSLGSTSGGKASVGKAFKCPIEGCNKVYSFSHHLKVHSRAHTGVRPFACTHAGCGKTFSTGYGLKSHFRIHTGEKPYKCINDTCGKAFKTSGDLQKHIRTHTGERPFKCDFEGCDRSFTTSNIRKVHMRVHTGERPYVCEVKNCKKTFSSATNYKNHMRIHSGERPYACTYPECNKRFTEYSSLYKHHVVHTMAKPYTCEICGKTYRQTSTLATHRRTYHGVIETVLQVNDTGAPNISISGGLKLDGTDKLLADGNIIITKSVADVSNLSALGEDTTVVTMEEGAHSLDDVQKFEILEHGESLEDKNQNEEATSIMNIVGEAENSLGQQIYVLADSSQISFLQHQMTHGQLLATIPIDSVVEGSSEMEAVIEAESTDVKDEGVVVSEETT